jgi:hypothetical protein
MIAAAAPDWRKKSSRRGSGEQAKTAKMAMNAKA